MRLEVLGPGPKSLDLKPLGQYIDRNLANTTQNGEFYVAVALSDAAGLRLLEKHVHRIVRQNGTVKAVMGIDLGIAQDVFDQATQIFGIGNVFLYKNPKDSVFHPKMYLIKVNESFGTVIVGSSNLTNGGFLKNFEINLAIELDLRVTRDRKIFEQFVDLFRSLTNEKSSQVLTKNLMSTLISALELKKHTSMMSRTAKPPKLSKLFKGEKHGWENTEFKGKTTFLMTLSYADVSGARMGDEYIRIPVLASKRNPQFWGWTNLFRRSRRGHPERFITIHYNGQKEMRRLYFVPRPDELRLVMPQIYNLGRGVAYSILKISKKKAIFEMELIRKKDKRYSKYLRWCTETCPRGKAKIPKVWGYV
jgi:HKD family nuclease